VDVSGVCGELTGEMVMRFRRDILERRPRFVVLLGGTNDLGWNAQPQEIMRNLVQMFEQALAAGITPVAVTVPSIRMDGALESGSRQWFEDHIRRRVVLNRLLLDYAAGKGIACADLFTATAEPESLALAARYSNDGLHLTTEGYRTLAALVYECVSSRLTEQTREGNR
jgi:lysophospholipase L1-like esterase